MAQGTGRGELLSIWFFVGVLMLAYGIVLFPYGAWESVRRPRACNRARTSCTRPSGGGC